MTDNACPQCSKSHVVTQLIGGWNLPDEVWAIPQGKRPQEAKYYPDLVQWGERYFIRSLLRIPFSDHEGYFSRGVWIEVEEGRFKADLCIYESDGSNEPRIPVFWPIKYPVMAI